MNSSGGDLERSKQRSCLIRNSVRANAPTIQGAGRFNMTGNSFLGSVKKGAGQHVIPATFQVSSNIRMPWCPRRKLEKSNKYQTSS